MSGRCAAGFMFALGVALAFASPAAARNLALVIGNDAYANVPALKTAAGDANAVGDRLEKLGFIVRRAIDVDRPAMSRALVAFDADIEPGDRAMFFFSGHGFEISGANYLLPTDVPLVRANQADLLRDSSFPVERVIDGMRERGARVAVLVLDACRDNPFASPGARGAAASGGLARVDAPEGVFVLMAAGAKQEALDRLSLDDNARNSVFTRVFLNELAPPGRTLVQIAKATQVGVKTLAASVGYEQTPAYYDQVVGDIVLSDSTSAPVASAPAPVAVAQSDAPARQQVAALAPNPAAPAIGGAVRLGPGPIANFSRSNAGWTVTLSLPEPAIGISWRLGEAAEFKSTGLSDALDQRTGRRAPNPSFPLSNRTPATIIQVRYETADGASVGPFPIRFDPDAALFAEQKQILESMPGSWVEFRDFNGVLVYFTTLVTYRCAISELRYGLDDGKPLQRYDLPPCDARNPFSVPSDAALYMKVPLKTRQISLQITWRDGTQSEISAIPRD